jgi:hypothetical protein
LACIFVLGSHGHHLRGKCVPREGARPDPWARRRVLLVAALCAPAAADGQGQRARKDSLLAGCWGWCYLGPFGAVPAQGLVELGSAGGVAAHGPAARMSIHGCPAAATHGSAADRAGGRCLSGPGRADR